MSEKLKRVQIKPETEELEVIVLTLREIARQASADYAELVVRQDGRTEIQTHDIRRGFKTVHRFDFDDAGNLTEVPLYAFPVSGR